MNGTTTTTNAIFNTPELAKKADIMLQAYSSGLYDVNQITARAIFDGMNKDQIQFIRNEIAKNDERRAELARKIKEEYDNRPEQEKESLKMIEKATNFLKSFFLKWPHPLPLIPGLTDEAAEMKVYSPEKARAELVCNRLPAIIHNIQIIAERGKSGYEFLKEYGEIFNTTEKQYFPTWGVRHFSNLIREETSRRLFFYTSLYSDAPKADGENAPLENELEEIRQLRKNTISELRKFPETLNAFYSSAYHQAYTIAQAVPVTYQQKESDVYTIRELGILYFFATSNITPDTPAILTTADEMNLSAKIQNIDNFFSQTKGETQYNIFIDYLNHDIRLLELPDRPQKINTIPKTAAALDEKYRHPNLVMYGEKGNLLYATNETCRIITNAISNYFYEAGKFKRPPNRPITVKMRDFVKTITIRPPVRLTGEKWGEYAREIMNAVQTLNGIIDGREYQIIGKSYYEPETDDFSFTSPYCQYWYERIYATAGEYIDKKTKEIKKSTPIIAFLKYDMAREKKEIQELAYEIFARMQKSQSKKYYHYNPARLIRDHCPTLYAKIEAAETSSAKSQIIRRAYQRFYKILKEKTDFFDYFLPPKKDGKQLPLQFRMINTKTGEIAVGEIYPTYKYWEYVTIEIDHGGRNPKYHA